MNAQMRLKALAIGIVAGVFLSVGVGKITAAEGTFELRNVSGSNARCFAASILMQDFNYRILVSCRDLIYPAATDVFNYVMWAQEEGNDNVRKLGVLGFGKAEFSYNKAFNRLFVTLENNAGVRNPSDQVVMVGDVRRIEVLSEPAGLPGVPVATLEPSPSPDDNNFLSPTTRDQEERSGFSVIRLVIGILVGVVVFVVIVALVSASRRRPIE